MVLSLLPIALACLRMRSTMHAWYVGTKHAMALELLCA